MRILLLLIITLIAILHGHAQKQDNVWCMGHYGGVDFNTDPPTKFESSIYSIETAASISDKHTGRLLFYTDGAKIWDGSHGIMENGTDIGQDGTFISAAQGAVIVPFINNENKYYLFSIPAIGKGAGQLFYSIVDMTLNNGLGAVVPGMKKIKIGDNFTEAITALQGCGVVWIVTQSRAESADFYAYKISTDGISSEPVISPRNYQNKISAETGLRASHDSKTIASISKYLGPLPVKLFIALQDFDPATGKISNGRIIDSSENDAHYGCEFSPNGKLLYVTASNGIYQYNISLNTKDIAASKTLIGQSSSYLLNNLQLRDDGSIYIVRYKESYLDKISNCDALAPGCVFTDKALEVGGEPTYNMPQKIVYPKEPIQLSVSSDTTICPGDTITLECTVQPTGASILWTDGSTGSSIKAFEKGTYTVTATNNGCYDSEEVIIDYHPPTSIELGKDTTICKGITLLLPQQAVSTEADQYIWQDGSTDNKFKVTQPGVYKVSLSGICQTVSDSIVITGRNCSYFFPSIFTPNGDGRNDIARLVGDIGALTNFRLSIFNRWGERVFTTTDPTIGWDGIYKNQPAELGTYYYQVQYKYLGDEELMKGDIILMR